MRGGIYSNDYFISKDDFIKHVKHFNTKIANTYIEFFEKLPESILYSELGELIKAKNDSNLYRLFLEYLPLTFSRRHGDPSRPWNVFNINVKDKDGNRILYYQGNWRDIYSRTGKRYQYRTRVSSTQLLQNSLMPALPMDTILTE
jgi:hypothetical protein